ncbi:uncharacterized protein LOC124273438 [Haliotis rubra]|uniref:uncharacterized protein LOC124273438 n=1 Tax=Haliotis rubra TaxID=36100 RepID=UPI001EE5517C|nr:uncharacterized protein LOC124273438 [Haliotis rubra]
MTDGLSNYPINTEAAAAGSEELWNYHFSVGVNPLLNFPSSPYQRRYETELRSIASSNETVFQVENFSTLSDTMDRILEILSSSKDGGMSEWGSWSVPACPPLTCENPTSLRNATRTRSCNNPPPLLPVDPAAGHD